MESKVGKDVPVIFYVIVQGVLYTLPYFFSFKSNLYFDIAFCLIEILALILTYVYLRKKFARIGRFLTLISLHILILPGLQVAFFYSDYKQFAFNQDFLDQKVSIANQELKKLEGSDDFVQIIKDKKFSLLQSEIPDSCIGKKYKFDNYSIGFRKAERQRNRPNHRKSPSDTLSPPNNYIKIGDIYFFDSKKKVSLLISNEKFIDVLTNAIKEREILISFIKNPVLAVRSNDIWLDSISGFLLGNVKPNSRISQMIQLIQVFNLFLLTLVLSEFIIKSNYFSIQQKR